MLRKHGFDPSQKNIKHANTTTSQINMHIERIDADENNNKNSKATNKQTNERTNERANEQTSKQANKQTNGQTRNTQK